MTEEIMSVSMFSQRYKRRFWSSEMWRSHWVSSCRRLVNSKSREPLGVLKERQHSQIRYGWISGFIYTYMGRWTNTEGGRDGQKKYRIFSNL